MKITVVIPAYNEEDTIGGVVREALQQVDEVLVIDDGSLDATKERAAQAGARVIKQSHGGYLQAIKRGFLEAKGDIVVTLDGDGEHRPVDIGTVVEPIVRDRADMVLGSRKHIARPSERFISALCRRKTGVRDTGTGFRAMRRGLALRLTFPGVCICGTSVLEAKLLGARILEVPITLKRPSRPRKIAWQHGLQLLHVIRMLSTPVPKHNFRLTSK